MRWRGRLRLGSLGILAATLAASGLPATAADVPVGPTVLNVLPPGNSGLFTVAGQAQGQASGNPADYGPNIDDQRQLYWSFTYKPGSFRQPQGGGESPLPGVTIERNSYGIPAIYLDDASKLFYGMGYAQAQDRLFEMDAIRRTGEGRLSELVGPGSYGADVQARVRTYTDAEYAQFMQHAEPSSQTAVLGYVAGVNAWIQKVTTTEIAKLPAEYALLTSVPEPWTVKDTLAAGVLITRTVASAGGEEYGNIHFLKELETRYGKVEGRKVYQDLFWVDDPKAVVTLPPSAPAFSNNPTPPAGREAAFQAAADYADSLPDDLASGIGTGAATPAAVVAGAHPTAAQLAVLKATSAITRWAASLHGGSYTYALAPSKTKNHKTLLESAPQLGYTYPTLLYEQEIHGAGYDARGVVPPGLPVVGIGYNQKLAWGLTTGDSKTIDSFIETTRANPTPGGSPQYQHNGRWLDESCRDEVMKYRQVVNGVPVGPPVLTKTVNVCRTLHGPVVAVHAGGTMARSVQYAMFMREINTLDGVLGWDRDQDLASFKRDEAKVAWNENTMYADADGHIAYWHPGLYPLRAVGVDPRFPSKGDGTQDWQRLLTFDEMPHAIDPPEGFMANWNNLPAHGWDNGEVNIPSERPEGANYRLDNATDQLAARNDFTLQDLVQVDRTIGTHDARFKPMRPLIAAARPGANGSVAAAMDLLLSWDGSYFGAGAGTSPDNKTDGPAPTYFDFFIQALEKQLFSSALPADIFSRGASGTDDQPNVLELLALRNMVPGYSGLTSSRDYLGGQTANQVVLAAATSAVSAASTKYSALATGWRRDHPTDSFCSLTGGVIGPCATMPMEDRGTWIMLVENAGPGGGAAGVPTAAGGGGGTPNTARALGPFALLLLVPLLAVALLSFGRPARE